MPAQIGQTSARIWGGTQPGRREQGKVQLVAAVSFASFA
jgi:hypothetical protein